ncbi:hypothetical protein E4O03_09645 [Treponema sp. OMZ 792]|uniref:hypothetical protein n=1 Tax=unclassified Treponema TaxID=2638727 RepID=UPI0020A28F53|nr:MULTISPECIES: hypothetical protein [unclassified Treponema]UTC74473.1 hypothetical protein E4O03_09645 [Treponema sp. OMZ 792]UTC80870.1 hypothetical protein E4O07_09550 [Treponema sp. OMZ 798]
MEKNYRKLGVLILIFLGLVGAGTLAVYQKLKVPLGQPAKAQAELSKTETAELEKPKQETENTEPKKELKKEEPKRVVPIKTPRKEVPKKAEPKKIEPKKASKEKESEVSADHVQPAEPPEKPSMGISLADRDKKTFNWSLGLLAEANMNSPEACAMGAGLYTLFMLPLKLKIGHLSLGAKALYSYDFKKHHIFDAALLFRWNFYDFSKIKERDSGFFIQLEGGAVFGLKESEPSKLFMYALGEAAFGYRFTINNFFIEPYLRGGYPVIWAIGISGGYRI